MNTTELLAKLKSEGWTLESDRIYPDGCTTFLRLGSRLVDELKRAGILRQVKGCPGDWEVNPMAALIGKDTTSVCPTDQGRTNPLGFRRFLSQERRAA